MPELTDSQLADQLRHNRSLAEAARAEAIGLTPMPRKLVTAVWAHFSKRSDQVAASDQKAQVRIARDAAAAMRAFAVMAFPLRLQLEEAETQIGRGGYVPAVAAAADAILTQHPVLGPIKDEIDREAAEKAAEVERLEAAKRAAEAEQFPAVLLERLRRAGVHLALDTKGRVAAPANQAISANDRHEIIEHYDGIAAALKAEAEAKRLVPVK